MGDSAGCVAVMATARRLFPQYAFLEKKKATTAEAEMHPLYPTTHIPQVQLDDRVLFYEYDHRADELIGLNVDVPGEFITGFELVFVQEP